MKTHLSQLLILIAFGTAGAAQNKVSTVSTQSVKFEQPDQVLQKIILADACVYKFMKPQGPENAFELTEVSSDSAKTIFRYFLASAGFEKNPICWDVLDRNLISFPLYTDSHKQTNAMLFYYNLDSLIRIFNNYDPALDHYLVHGARSLSSAVPPFDLYNDMIYYRNDTLRGRLFIDFTCNKDSFSFYIHIENKKTLEKWRYTPFSRALGYTTVKDPKKKAWIKQKEYNVDFSGPFRAFAANNKNYLITEDGRIMLILTDSIKEIDCIADIEQKTLVFDKDRNQLRTIRKKSLESIKGPLSPEVIHRKSKLVIDFNH